MALMESNASRPDLRKRVIERLEHSIKMGGYRTDEKLPTEHELAAEFQVSRPIIRDVLQILRDKGLIYSRQGSGSYVKSNGYKPPLSFTPISTRLDVQNFYAFRLAIEPTAAELAASRLTEAEVIQLSLSLHDMRLTHLPYRSRLEAYYQFHTNIARASGNSFFSTTISALNSQVLASSGRDSPHHLDATPLNAVVFEEHQHIYDSLRIRDERKANETMKLHLFKALTRFTNSITP